MCVSKNYLTLLWTIIFVQNLKPGFEVSSDIRRIHLATMFSGVDAKFNHSVTRTKSGGHVLKFRNVYTLGGFDVPKFFKG